MEINVYQFALMDFISLIMDVHNAQVIVQHVVLVAQ